jgi:hypothetical protein
MKVFYSRSNGLIIALLVMLVTGQAVASQLVLCFGQDGRYTFERAYAGKCAPGQPQRSAEEPSSSATTEDGHCAPCHDIPAPSSFLHGRTHTDQYLSTLFTAPAVTILPLPGVEIFLRDLEGNPFSKPPPQPYNALTALRAVVLLN